MERAEDLIPMFGFHKIIDYLSMGNSVNWYDHVLNVDGRIMRMTLGLEDEGQKKKEKAWKKHIEEESMKGVLSMEEVLCRWK